MCVCATTMRAATTIYHVILIICHKPAARLKDAPSRARTPDVSSLCALRSLVRVRSFGRVSAAGAAASAAAVGVGEWWERMQCANVK